ncbi:alpha-1-antitrypsin-like [Hyperolius riggenbachi]|uniref:alpha-1-antitrypsin-like n=1 Tax=Hyperolius riggenbachi TaxID=752182 RepID=UPI0035A3C6BE
MRFLLYLGLSVALLYSSVFADHHGDHKKNEEHEKHDHSKEGKDHHHVKKPLPSQRIAPQNAKFGYDLFRQISSAHPSENIVLSPISIATALALLALGAKANTHDQIIEGIGFNMTEISEKEIHGGFQNLREVMSNKTELHLDSGNGLFISKEWNILDEFLDNAKKLYDSEVFSTDFQDNEVAKKQINSYVDKHTNGKIPEVLSSVDKEAVFILANFIYFRGEWEKPFEEEFTKEGDFHVSDKVTVKVPFMWKLSFFQAAFLEDADVVAIPYKGDANALIILPKEGKMKDVEDNLQDIVMKYVKTRHTGVLEVRVPKFSVESSFELKDVFAKLGIVDLFSNNADLSGITGAPNLMVSKALHKAKMSIDEKGTEAAATTVIEGIPTSLPPSVTFDRPFIFNIYDHTIKTSVFWAKITNPLK